jgi:hypothetical protein
LLPIGQAGDWSAWPDYGPREGSLVKYSSGHQADADASANVVTPLNERGG